MLAIVPKAIRYARFLALAAAVAAFAGTGKPLGETSGRRAFAQQAPPAPAATSQEPAQPPGVRTLQTVVLDPAHGGTDEGAHGAGGIVEKNVVLALARIVGARIEKTGLNVVMTRQTDKTLSFQQRAAIANAQPNAVFITLHVGSSGPVGSAFAYYYDFNQVVQNQSGAAAGLVDWDRAQLSWQPLSERLAQLLQVELSERLPGSPELPSGAAVYQLREIDEPAVAVEVENVNAPSAASLDRLGKPLAKAITRAIQAFRIVYGRGTS